MLRGKLVRLREFRIDDIPAILGLQNDEATRSKMILNLFTPATEATIRQEFLDETSSVNFRYILVDLTGQFMGFCHFKNNFKDRRTTLSFEIALPAQNKGYGSDSLDLMLNFIFQEMNMNKCSISILSDDAAARQLLETAGFIVEVVSREEVFRNGAYRDVLILGLLKSDYLAALGSESTN